MRCSFCSIRRIILIRRKSLHLKNIDWLERSIIILLHFGLLRIYEREKIAVADVIIANFASASLLEMNKNAFQ